MNGDTITPQELEIRSLKSQVAGLQVNRDSLFEENKRFRAEAAKLFTTDLQTSNNRIIELERIIVEAKGCLKELQELNDTKNELVKELKSELEGKVDAANEAIYQLELKIRLDKEARKDLRIEIVQMSGRAYFWALMRKDVHLAHSRVINVKAIVEPEAYAVAAQLGLPVVVNERK